MSDDTDTAGEATLFPKTVGERLRDARLAQKLDLADIAQRTRIPLRQLEAIEEGDYSRMPTPTYAVGFAKAYARAVGEDEAAVAREVRGQAEVTAARKPEYQPYDIEEAPRAPSGGVMIGAIALALLLVVGAGLWYGTSWFRGDGLDPAAPAAAPADPTATTPVPAATPATAAQVTLVANDEVWVRIYDAAGRTLKQGTLAAGERYDVPADATGPMINVGRPDKLQVLVNGTAVPALGDGRVAIKDVGISAAALGARGQPAAPGAESRPAAPTPAASAAPRTGSGARGDGSIPPFFRDSAARPAPQPTRTQAAPASTGQRDAPPPAATPGPAAAATATAAPGNGF